VLCACRLAGASGLWRPFCDSWAVLGLAALSFLDVDNRCFQAVFVVDVSAAATFCPPVRAEISIVACCQLLVRFQMPRRPCLQLLADFVGVNFCTDHHVQVIGPAVHSKQFPLRNLTVILNGLFHDVSLRAIQDTGFFFHSGLSFSFENGIRQLVAAVILDPAALVSRQPCPIRRPRQKIRERFGHRDFASGALHHLHSRMNPNHQRGQRWSTHGYRFRVVVFPRLRFGLVGLTRSRVAVSAAWITPHEPDARARVLYGARSGKGLAGALGEWCRLAGASDLLCCGGCRWALHPLLQAVPGEAEMASLP